MKGETFLSDNARFMGTFQKIKADLQSVIVETKSHQTAHLLSYAYGFTHIHIFSILICICPQSELLDSAFTQ